jgi:hypothetical protein
MVEVEPVTIDFSALNQSKTVSAKALEMRGDAIPSVVFTFSSENSAVASVDSDGIVKPVGNGSAVITAKAPNGVKGESFVRVCLPKEVVCTPKDKLMLRVGLAAPIQCHVTNCKDVELPAPVTMDAADKSVVLMEDNVFTGLKVGDTQVTVKAFNLATTVGVHVDEPILYPDEMASSSGGKGSQNKGGGKKGSSDPYGSGGRFDHILKNIKINTN